MKKRVSYQFSLVILSVWLLSACTGLIEVNPPTPTPEMAASGDDTALENQPAAPPVVDNPAQAEGDTQTDPVDEGEQAGEDQGAPALPPKPALGFENGDSQLEATNPDQVDLSSGELYLVELFAFW